MPYDILEDEAPATPGGYEILGDEPAETPGTLEGIANSFRRGNLAGQRSIEALQFQTETPTIKQGRRAFVGAMEDPRYMEGLMGAEDPAKVESLFGPTARLRAAMGPAKASNVATAQNVADLTKQANAIPSSAAMQEWSKADNSNWWQVFARNPVEITANIFAESIPQAATGMAAGMAAGAAGGPIGAGVGAGVGSFTVEAANAFLEAAANSGVNLEDPEQVRAFFSDEAKVKEAKRFAMTRGFPIALFDGLTAGVAGKFLKPALGKGMARVAGASVAELGTQMAGGALGETAAQVASGQELSAKDIAAEAIGELATAPGEVFSNLRGEARGYEVLPDGDLSQNSEKPKETKPEEKPAAVPVADTSADALAELQAVLRGEAPGSQRLKGALPKVQPEPAGTVSSDPVVVEKRVEVPAALTEEQRAAIEFQRKTDEAVKAAVQNPDKNYEGMSRLELELLEGMGDARATAALRRMRARTNRRDAETQREKTPDAQEWEQLLKPDIRRDLRDEGVTAENVEALLSGKKTAAQVVDEQLGLSKSGGSIDATTMMVEENVDGSRSIGFAPPAGPASTTPVNVGQMSHVDAILMARDQGIERIQAIFGNRQTTSPPVDLEAAMQAQAKPANVLPKHKLSKPISGTTGAKIIGYEWRSTMGEKWNQREGGYVDARVSDWDNADESKGTGRQIVHVYFVEHPDGRVTTEGIRSAQNVLGISESRLQTIAKKAQAEQAYAAEQDRLHFESLEKTSEGTPGEASKLYRKLNWSQLRTDEENERIFNKARLYEKNGRFVRTSTSEDRMRGAGWQPYVSGSQRAPQAKPAKPAKPPTAAAVAREQAKEFDRLVLENGMQAGWVTSPESLYDDSVNVNTGHGTGSIKAKILRSKELARARKQAAAVIGAQDVDLSDTAARGALAARLKEWVAANVTGPARQNDDFSQSIEKGAVGVPVSEMKVGDTLNIEGEAVRVVEVSADGEVTLQDGTRFGRQVLQDGSTIYAEEWQSVAEEGADSFPALEAPVKQSGQSATRELVTWLRNSKIVTKDGAPLVVYHTGKVGNSEFKTRIGSDENTQAQGTYFAVDRKHSEGMYEGETREYYLRIENPFVGDIADFYESQLADALDLFNQARDSDFASWNEAKETLGEKFQREVEKHFGDPTTSDGTAHSRAVFNNLEKWDINPALKTLDLESEGYDGQWDDWQIIAFEPDQIRRRDSFDIRPDSSRGEPPAKDSIESALDKAIEATNFKPGQVNEGVTGAPVWLTRAAANGALRIVRAAYRGARSLAQAIRDAVEYLRAQNLPDFNEQEAQAWLESKFQPGVRDELAVLTAQMDAIKARGEEIPAAMLDDYKELVDTLGDEIRSGRANSGAGRVRVDDNLEESGGRSQETGTARRAIPQWKGAERLPGGRLKDLFMGLRAWRVKSGNWLARRGARESIVVNRDVADNRANQAANAASLRVRLILNRAFDTKPGQVRVKHEVREAALTFVVEADGERSRLSDFYDQIGASEHADTKAGRQALAALEYAEANWDKLQPAAAEYKTLTETEREAELNEGVNSPEWKGGYVKHSWTRDDVGAGADPTKPAAAGTPFRKPRSVATYAEGIAQGRKPTTLNALELLADRVAGGQRKLNELAWVHGLRNLTDPATDMPVVVDVIKKPRKPANLPPEGSERAQAMEDAGETYKPDWVTIAPEGYTVWRFGELEVAVQDGFVRLLNDLTWPSVFKGSAAKKVFGFIKSSLLMFDTFHLGRMVAWRQMFGLGGGYQKGQTLLDFSTADIREMASRGEIPEAWADGLLENKRRLDLALRTGFNVGNVLDNAWGDALHNLPVIGTFNHWLFGQYQRGAMTEAWLIEFERMSKALPNASEEQVARRISKDLNARFGNLNRQGLFKSRTYQDLARFILLAPQWNESLIRAELGAIGQTLTAPLESIQQRRLVVGTLMRATGAMALGTFLANQILNYAFRGKPTWENEEEGWDKKISAYIPDAVSGGPGFFLNPLALPMEYTHLIEGNLHRSGGDLSEALRRVAVSRLHAGMRPLEIFATRKDALGAKLRDGEVLPAMAKALIPIPIGAVSPATAAKQLISGEPSERFPGQYQKQMMASFGVKTDQAPTAEQRIRNLAREFNREKGIVPSAEFFTGDFDELNKALRIGNNTEARKALDELLLKKTPRQVFDHYKRAAAAPFTGQQAREREFWRGLTEEQRSQYLKAREARKATAKKAAEMLKAVAKPAAR